MERAKKPQILVIGTASIDRLHLADQQIHKTIGGAGMYTALAAACAGAAVTLFAPRPDPLPKRFRPLANRINWIGPQVPENEMPRLEIAHYGGGQAELIEASWGAEKELLPQNLPDDLSAYATIHIAALSSAQRQLAFLHVCRARTAKAISVGTYARVVHNESAAVMALFEQADLFFMNENEANGLFGSLDSLQTTAGKLLFVTQGEQGALLVEEDQVRSVPSVSAIEVDPTGAGDSFCGTTLAKLAQGFDGFRAAKDANNMAAQMIQQVGPAKLYEVLLMTSTLLSWTLL